MKALALSAASAVSVLATYWVIYFTSPKDPEYAGSGFSWTVTHFMPVVFVSSVVWLVALIYIISIRKKLAQQPLGVRMASRLLLVPYLLFLGHAGWKLAPLFLQ